MIKKLILTLFSFFFATGACFADIYTPTDNLWTQAGITYIKQNSGLNLLIYGANKYLNFGSTSGATGYGFRDNSGSMEVKDSGGSWSAFMTPTYIGNVDITGDLDVSGTLTVGTIDGGFTTGSVIFEGASGLTEDNANFFWDDTNDRLGIGTTSPSYDLDVVGTSRTNNNLLVGATTGEAGFIGAGDIYALDSIKAKGGFFAEAQAYGAGIEVLSNGNTNIYDNVGDDDATLTASTKTITDSNATFVAATYEGAFMIVLSSTPSYTGAVGEIIDVLDTTHMVVSFATSNGDTIVDATAMTYVVYNRPVFFAGDNGYVAATIGNNTDAQFGIKIPEGNGFTGVYIDDIAGADQHQALTIDVDSQGYDGIVGLNVFMQNASSTNPSDGVLEAMVSLEGNANNYLNSSLRFLDFNLIGTGTDNDVDIMHINNFPLTSHIIHSGNPNDLERAYYDDGDGTTIDSTTAFNSTATNITLFENDNSIIYIAGATDTEFINMAFDISTESQRNINAEYYYCDGDDSWKILPSVVDTTNGFKQSGSINFMNPVDRGQCNEEIDSTAFADTDARSYIAIKRRRSNNWVGQKPIENLVSISGGGSYLYMDSYGLKPVPSSGAPYACSATTAGMQYYDSSDTHFYGCNATSWTQLDN